jgi:pyruvate kinase
MNDHRRRTKILATLGPATDAPGVLDALLAAGVNVVRLNFSHGDPASQVTRAQAVREAAQRAGCEVGILADLPGPKLRIERFAEGKVQLRAGDRFDLVARSDAPPGTASEVGISYLGLPNDVRANDTLLLDDGLMQLRVERIEGERIITTVLNDGALSDRKGLNRLGGGLSLGALTDRDRELIAVAAQLGAEFIAVSFCRNAADMQEARAIARSHGSDAALMAKIERAEAIENLAEIIDASDAVMLSQESAAGKYPLKAVEAMVRICIGAEKQFEANTNFEQAQRDLQHTDQAIAMATMFLSEHIGVRAIVAMTESGGTARHLSRFRSNVPIFGLSRHVGARRRMALMRDVFPIDFDSRGLATREAAREALKQLYDHALLAEGDRVIITSGDHMEQHGATNTLRLLQVGTAGKAEGLGEL